MIRHINSHPVPRFRNASHDDDGGDTSSITTLAQALHHSKRRRRVKREDISAALSKNITMILEDLLKDYDKTERPAFKKGITIFERSKLLLASCFLSLFSKCHDITLSKRLFWRCYTHKQTVKKSFVGLCKAASKKGLFSKSSLCLAQGHTCSFLIFLPIQLKLFPICHQRSNEIYNGIADDQEKNCARRVYSFLISGQATKVKINILIRSMGPISEEDMVSNTQAYRGLLNFFHDWPLFVLSCRIIQWTATFANTGVTNA